MAGIYNPITRLRARLPLVVLARDGVGMSIHDLVRPDAHVAWRALQLPARAAAVLVEGLVGILDS